METNKANALTPVQVWGQKAWRFWAVSRQTLANTPGSSGGLHYAMSGFVSGFRLPWQAAQGKACSLLSLVQLLERVS